MCLYLTLLNNLIYVARILDRILEYCKKSSKTRQHQKILISASTEFLTAKVSERKTVSTQFEIFLIFPNFLRS